MADVITSTVSNWRDCFYATRLKTDVETAADNFVCVFLVDMVDSQRQQTEERALKMKSVLVKTKKELAEAKKQVSRLSPTLPRSNLV